MLYSSILLTAASASVVSAAWNYSTSYSTDGPIAVNPDTVDSTTKNSWCLAEHNSCGQLCGQYSSNTCSTSDLTYNCTCASGVTPNISDYAQTLPSLVCAQWRIDCVAAHPNDADGQAGCQSVTCGSKNASDAQSSSTSSSASSSTTSSSASSGTAGASTTGSSASSATAAASSAAATGAAIALNVGKSYGSGILAAGMLAFFGLAL